VAEEELRQLLGTGQLPQEVLVWRPGLTDWTKASLIPELQVIRLDPPAPRVPDPEGRNLFEAPKAVALTDSEPTSLEAKEAVAGALEALRATKPWARFLGVLGIIGISLMILGSIAMAFMSRGAFRGMSGPLRVVLPLVYLLMGAFQIPPAIYLNRYASRIGALLQSHAPDDLARALEAQKAFWRYVGIFALVMICIYGICIVIVLGVAGFAAAGRRF
jgi:hypothetical protein